MEYREVVPKEVDQSNRYKYLLRYLPEDERFRSYMEARNRILSEHQLSGMRLVSRRVRKERERFRIRRSRRREAVATVKRIDSADPRPFPNVETLGVVTGNRLRREIGNIAGSWSANIAMNCS